MGYCERAALVAALAIALLLAVLVSTAFCGPYSIQFNDGRTDVVQTIREDGEHYFRLADLARAFGASRHWNPRTSKMSLAVGIHRVSMASGSQFVSLDDGAMNIGRPVLLIEGEYWVPERFLSSVLALAVNSEIGVSSVGPTISVIKLGAVLMSLDVEERAGTTVAILALNDRAPFVASSRDRGRVDVFLPGASMPDSLYELAGSGLVTSVRAERTEAGVSAVVRVAPSATSYEAQMHTDPPRLEVAVASERSEVVPAPLLKGTVNLLGAGIGPTDNDGRITTVMIDPGHGGTDAGRTGLRGLVEKDVALGIADRIASELRREGFYVFMTRSSDSYVSVKRRAEIANLAGADVFVSVHCGSWHSGAASGHRVTYFSPTEEYLVDKNRAGGRGLRRGNYGARREEVGDLLWGEIQEELADQSRALADAIDSSMSRSLPNADRGVGGADLSMLAGCAMPAVLVEPAYITNPSDAELLSDPDFLENVGRAVARGVAEYARAAEGRNR
jgi:N-acetylmuramoyl-L-alanine amidase